MERKLASVRRIAAIEPIPGADQIPVTLVDGWKVVIRKDEVQVGDIVVYFEIDSFLPQKEPYLFLRASSAKKNADGKEGFLLRTVKFRGQISQGLILPITAFPELGPGPFEVGTDVTTTLGVKLYEAPIPTDMSGTIKGPFPGFLRKTDQERIQNLLPYFQEHLNNRFEVTEKVDGTSGTFYWFKGEFGVCGRNWELVEDDTNTHWQLARQLDLKGALAKFNRNIALQGEIVGPKINNNPLALSRNKLLLFDIYDIDRGTYLTTEERMDMISQLQTHSPQLEHVPIVAAAEPMFTNYPSVDAMIAYATAPSLVNPKVTREGVVCKSCARLPNAIVSFKVISNAYLLAQK